MHNESVPLWMKLGFAVVAVWTAALWFNAIRYGYVCPAPWYERPLKKVRVRPFPTGPAPVNSQRVDGRAVVVNEVRADKMPGRSPMVTRRPPGRVPGDLKRNDSLHWKAQ